MKTTLVHKLKSVLKEMHQVLNKVGMGRNLTIQYLIGTTTTVPGSDLSISLDQYSVQCCHIRKRQIESCDVAAVMQFNSRLVYS